jgi:hypothetical protein
MTEQKDSKADTDKKDEVKVEEPKDKFFELKKNLVLLEKASKDKDFKMAGTLTKNLKKLRKMYDLPDAVLALSFYLPDLFIRLMLPTQPTPLKEGVKIEEMLHCTQARVDEIMITAEA